MREQKPTYVEFRMEWCRLAELGMCDSWGSAECRRVARAWVAAGSPDIFSFIQREANVPAFEDLPWDGADAPEEPSA